MGSVLNDHDTQVSPVLDPVPKDEPPHSDGELSRFLNPVHYEPDAVHESIWPTDSHVTTDLTNNFSELMPPLSSSNVHTEDLTADIPMFEIESHDMLTGDLMGSGDVHNPTAKGEVIGQPAQLLLPNAIGQPVESQTTLSEMTIQYVPAHCGPHTMPPLSMDISSGLPPLDLSLGSVNANNSSIDNLMPPSLHSLPSYPSYNSHQTVGFPQTHTSLDLADPSFPNNLDQHLRTSQPENSSIPRSTSFLHQDAQDVLTRDISAVLESTVETGIPATEGGMLLQSSSCLCDSWGAGLSQPAGWGGPSIQNGPDAGGAGIRGHHPPATRQGGSHSRAQSNTKKSTRGQSRRASAARSESNRGDGPEPRLILGKDSNDRELMIREKEKFNRVTFLCPPSLSGKQAGKLVADLSKMNELFNGSKGERHMIISEESEPRNLGRMSSIGSMGSKGAHVDMFHHQQGMDGEYQRQRGGRPGRMCNSEDDSMHPCPGGSTLPGPGEPEQDLRMKGLKRHHSGRRFHRAGTSVPTRQLADANEKLRSSFVRRVKKVRGGAPIKSRHYHHHHLSRLQNLPRRRGPSILSRPHAYARLSQHNRPAAKPDAVEVPCLQSVEVNTAPESRARETQDSTMWRLFQESLFVSCYWHLVQQGDHEAFWRGFCQHVHNAPGFYPPDASRHSHGGGSNSIGTRSSSSRKVGSRTSAPTETRHVIRPHGTRKKREITFENVRKVCDLPINEAANRLDIGVTVLKKYCRKFDIPRWPYRILSSLSKLISSMEETQEQDQSLASSPLQDEIRQLQDLKTAIESDPRLAQEIPEWVKKLRQHNFKFEYKKRQNEKKFTTE
ncbi:hypothetical protein BSKO_07280 [Bryopsis sp. KO-2023]|nr:hypothetical protein BSKO_07280 [Bryopsis sp. KO-2023]